MPINVLTSGKRSGALYFPANRWHARQTPVGRLHRKAAVKCLRVRVHRMTFGRELVRDITVLVISEAEGVKEPYLRPTRNKKLW